MSRRKIRRAGDEVMHRERKCIITETTDEKNRGTSEKMLCNSEREMRADRNKNIK